MNLLKIMVPRQLFQQFTMSQSMIGLIRVINKKDLALLPKKKTNTLTESISICLFNKPFNQNSLCVISRPDKHQRIHKEIWLQKMTKKAVLFDQKKRIIWVNRGPSLCAWLVRDFFFYANKDKSRERRFFSLFQCSAGGDEYVLYTPLHVTLQ